MTSPLQNLNDAVGAGRFIAHRLIPYLDEIKALQLKGVSLKEIGEALGLNSGQIYWALPRAQKLAQEMDEQNLKQNSASAPVRSNTSSPFRPGKHANRFNTELKNK